jgi:hypothetical protein
MRRISPLLTPPHPHLDSLDADCVDVSLTLSSFMHAPRVARSGGGGGGRGGGGGGGGRGAVDPPPPPRALCDPTDPARATRGLADLVRVMRGTDAADPARAMCSPINERGPAAPACALHGPIACVSSDTLHRPARVYHRRR